MNPLIASMIASGLRWLLTIGAAQGFATTDDQQMKMIDGAVMAATLLWSWYHKHRVDKKIEEAKTGI